MEFKAVTNGMRKVLPLKYCGAVIVAAGTASGNGGTGRRTHDSAYRSHFPELRCH